MNYPTLQFFFAQYIHRMHSVVNKKVGIVRFSDLVIIAFNYKESNCITMSTNLYYYHVFIYKVSR